MTVYIPEFVLGVLATLSIELLIIILIAVTKGKKNGDKENE